MGNRVKGRVKKKSIKAALSSSAGSKRKLSRMGKKQKKEHAGLEATFIGRSQCLKMLQITLKDFRRLCILKGIYPREPLGRVPRNKKGQTFYHIKDVRAIAHEPILEKFREFRAFMKKVRRAAGRNELDEAARKNALVPTYSLHHLVKERYPRFVDALSDMDDALTLTYLFAALPGEGDIAPRVITKAKSLVAAWGAYCATTSSITKAFVSVKGVYLEASIHGTVIRWIVPHAFTQYLPEDVDYKVMMTFFEFYETLLNFVLFKLYSDFGVRYPFPLKQLAAAAAGRGAKTTTTSSATTMMNLGSTSTLLGANLRALTNALQSQNGAIRDVVAASVEKDKPEGNDKQESGKNVRKNKNKELIKSVGAAVNTLNEESDAEEEEEDDDSVDVAGPLQAALESMAEEEARAALPGGTSSELDDESLKRKRLFAGLTFFLSREVPRGYLELVCLAYGGKVGWEGDDSPISMKDSSITHHIVDRPKLPSSYEALPKSREYVQPQWVLDCTNFMFLLPISKYAIGATLPPHLSPWVDDEEEGYKPAYAQEIEALKNGEVPEPDDVEDEEPDKKPDNVTETEEDRVERGLESTEQSDDDDQGEDEEEEEESEKEMSKRREKKRKQEEDEAHALAKTMMNRKAAHLYGRMQHGIARKQAKVDVLHKRRKEIEATKEKDTTGKTAQKQKVERLKSERKAIEDAYSNTGGSLKKRKKSRKS